jgi:thiamine-monophosphate kinase
VATTPARNEDAWLAEAFARLVPGPRVRLGMGHDAAVLRHDGRDVVLKTDTVVDGVDFVLAACGPAAAARKAVAVTLSDLAAVGAVPRALLVSAILPRGVTFETFAAIARGLLAAAAEFGADLVGGDTSVADAPLSLSVFATGDLRDGGPVGRSGAKPGQVLSVTGPLGGSIFGRHLTFSPRFDASAALLARRVPSAMMDLSDGLSRDLPRICRASGVGADVDPAAIPIHDDVRRHRDGRSPLEHALHDGEDFELLLAHDPLPPSVEAELLALRVRLHAIGVVTATPGAVRLVHPDGPIPLVPQGFDHLAGSASPPEA